MHIGRSRIENVIIIDETMMDVRTLFSSYVISKFLNNENIVLDHLFKVLFLNTSYLTDSYIVFK